MKTFFVFAVLGAAFQLQAGMVMGPTLSSQGHQAIYSIKDPPNSPYVWCVSWSATGRPDWQGNANMPSLTWTFPNSAPHLQFWVQSMDGTPVSNVLEVYLSDAAGENRSPVGAPAETLTPWQNPKDPAVSELRRSEIGAGQPSAVNIPAVPGLPLPDGPSAAQATEPATTNEEPDLKTMLADGLVLVTPNADGLIDAAAEANMLSSLGADTNPFKNRYRPPSTTKDAELVLGAIVIGPHSTVFFNDTPCGVGDTFLGMKVRAISARFIWLQEGKLLLQIPTDSKKISVRLPKT